MDPDKLESFIQKLNRATPGEESVLKSEAAQLAQKARNGAINLCYSKATEFSPDIEKLFLLSSKLALLAYGPGSADVEPYENDIYYYNNFEPPSYVVEDYEMFKKRIEKNKKE